MAVSVKTLMEQFGKELVIAGGVVIYRSKAACQKLGMVNKDGTVTLTPEGEAFLKGDSNSPAEPATESKAGTKEDSPKKPRASKATASGAASAEATKQVDTSSLDDLV